MSLSTYVVIGVLLVSFVIMIVALIISILIFVEYYNLPSLRIVIISVLLVIWLSTVTYLNFQLRFHSISDNALQTIGEISLISLILALMILSYMQINIIFGRRTRLLGSLSLGGFNLILAYVLSDLIGMTDFFRVGVIDRTLSFHFPSEMGILIVSSASFYLISFYSSFRHVRALPEYLVSSTSIFLIRWGAIMVIGLGLVLILLFTFLGGMIAPVMGLVIGLTLSLLTLSYVYFNYSQPFIQIGYGANPRKLLEQGYIGYYLGTTLDSGPTLNYVNESFLKASQLDRLQIQIAVVGVMTMVGINNSFAERLSLVPIPQSDDFISINLTFQVKNEYVSDPRYRDQAPSVLGIILPALMAPAIRNISVAQRQFSIMFQQISSLSDFSPNKIEEFTVKILHEILN